MVPSFKGNTVTSIDRYVGTMQVDGENMQIDTSLASLKIIFATSKYLELLNEESPPGNRTL